MFVTRRHPKAGRPLSNSTFPVEEDPKTGDMGFKIGYLQSGEPVLIRKSDMGVIVTHFNYTLERYETAFKKMNEHKTLKSTLIRLLGGSVQPPDEPLV